VSDVVAERREDALWLTLDRPERFNAYDEAMARELAELVAGTLDVAAIVITGRGRGFCAGGFLADLDQLDEASIRRLYRASLELFEAMRLHPRPVIAAVNGAAAGGGNELVVACDLAIAAESATFGQTGPRVGSSPVLGGANMLAMNVGEKRAKEIAFLCRRYSARDALAMGWINAVVPDGELESEVMQWCREIALMSPRYLEITKVSSNTFWNALRDAYVHGIGMLTEAIGSHDQREGARAFMEKRLPRWQPSIGYVRDGSAAAGGAGAAWAPSTDGAGDGEHGSRTPETERG
jgi:enoyl-CoA hydratase/carnithine racemase